MKHYDRMTVDAATIFQRTDSGRDTIKNKTFKLTQSERLLLIVIDGVTSYEGLRKEVWALSQDRFDRALKTLLDAQLILEVLFKVEQQQAEQLDQAVVERFLQQDPLDPVTIISVYPEDEFGTSADISSAAVPVPANGIEGSEQKIESLALATNTVGVTQQSGVFNPADPWPSSLLRATPSIFPDQTPQPVADDWPDEWPKYLEKETPRPNRMKWMAWVALGSGLLIIILFSYFQLRR